MTKIKNVPGEEVPLATTTPTPAATSDIKPDWVDDTANPEIDKSTDEVAEEQDFEGSAPNTDVVESKDTLEHAQDLGLHQNEDEEHPDEAGVAAEVNAAEARRKSS